MALERRGDRLLGADRQLADDPGALYPLGTLSQAGTMATAADQHILTAGLNIHALELVLPCSTWKEALPCSSTSRVALFDAGMGGSELTSGLDQGGGAPETDQPGGFWALTPSAISAKAFRQAD